MSSKSKGKKLSIPRELAAIQSDYQEKAFAAGQVQYQIKVFSDEIDRLNGLILQINNEAAARKELDNKKAEDLKAAHSEAMPADGGKA